jgi:hypothetical protein
MGLEDVNDKVIPAVYILSKIMPLFIKNALNNNKFDQLSKENKLLIASEFESLQNTSQHIIIIENTDFTVKKISIQRLLVSILFRFNEKYKLNSSVQKMGYIPIKIDADNVDNTFDDDDDDDDDGEQYKNYDNYRDNIMSIPLSYIYEYFRDILQQFKYTFYSNYLLNEEKTGVKDSNLNFLISYDKYQKVKFITLKNIYNFAKSLSIEKWSSDKTPKPVEYPLHWKSLEKEQKAEILNRLNNNRNNPVDWFNIKNNIFFILNLINESKTKYISNKYIFEYNVELYDDIKKELPGIILEIFIKKGLLTKFFPNKTLTDNSITPRKRIKIRESQLKFNPKLFSKSDSNEYWTSSYSYLTELPYKCSGLTFDAFRTNAWYSLLALDWVSQIGFCQKFISQRVTYITGATGVGKSTQVPKLYLYYLKALDYNTKGRVACTQPRKAPTSKNSETVSAELGFNIKYSAMSKDKKIIDCIDKYNQYDQYKTPDIDTNKNDSYTNNYYVQMEYKERKHTQKVQHLVLKYLIDATLINQLTNVSILLKQTKKVKDKISLQKDNLYDVLIIDESHEHNVNMDLLLTILRDFIYFNPSLRLVILSATMDDDEPTYRRFYRDINDNQKYPYDCFLRDSNLDRINIDRRFHISPPGYGTSFPILETYNKDINSNPVDIPDELLVAKVNELIKEGLKGDILIFFSGESDIKDFVEEINLNTPDNIIAIPFYSKLPDEKKKFVEDIDSKFGELRISKRQDFGNADTILSVGVNSYTNFIICATNMAEASITIERLYYVIERGTRKSQIYSYKQRQSKLEENNISESSRLQRRGRVGRTGPGHVYYMYQKELMSKNKISFEIATSNISQIVLRNLTSNVNADIFSKKTILEKIKNADINNYKYFERLYKINNKDFLYEGNPAMYDYEYESKYKPSLFDIDFIPKYSSSQLYDKDGSLYIVHPDELLFDRDIMGRIIKISNPKNEDIRIKYLSGKKYGIIESEKMDSFFSDLLLQKYIKNYNKEQSYEITEFGLFLILIQMKFDIFETETLIKPLIYSLLLATSSTLSIDVLRICVMLDVINCDITQLLQPEPKLTLLVDEKDKYNLNDLKQRLHTTTFTSSSEFDKINLLCKEFLSYLNKAINFDNFDQVDKIIASENNIDDDRYRQIMDNFDIAKDDEMSNDTIDHSIIISERIELKLNMPNIDVIIKQFCLMYNINFKLMKNFIMKYYLGIDIIKSFQFEDKRKVVYQEKIDLYAKDFAQYHLASYDKVLLSFLLAAPFNIAKKINNSERYILVYNPIAENMVSLNTDRIVKPIKILGKKTKIKTVYDPTILIEEYFLASYVFYFTLNQKNSMAIVANLSKEYLKLFESIYSYERINKIATKYVTKIDHYVKKLDLAATSKTVFSKTVLPKLMDDDIRALVNLQDTYKEILIELK